MSVKIIKHSEEHIAKAGMTLWDALKKIEVLPESVLATRDGEMITEDEILEENQTIHLIDVISGGKTDEIRNFPRHT